MTHRIEPDHGRSRVYAQWLNTEDDLQAAIGERHEGGGHSGTGNHQSQTDTAC